MRVLSCDIDVLDPQPGYYLVKALDDNALHIFRCDIVDNEVRWWEHEYEVAESHANILKHYELLLKLNLEGLAGVHEQLKKANLNHLELF